MSRVPDIIKIGGTDYDVEVVSGGFHTSYLGECSIRETKIRVAAGMSDEMTQETLLHETLEAIKASCDLEMNHQTLSTLSVMLHQVLKDNPGVFA